MSPALSTAQREVAKELIEEKMMETQVAIEQATQEAIEKRIIDLATEALSELTDRGYNTSQEHVKRSAIHAARETLFGSDTLAKTVEIAVAGRQNTSTEIDLDTNTPGPKMITEAVQVPVAGQEDSKYAGTVEVERVDPRSMRSNMEFQKEFEKEYSASRANQDQQDQSSDPEDVPVAGRRNSDYEYVDKQSMTDPAMEDDDNENKGSNLPWYQ